MPITVSKFHNGVVKQSTGNWQHTVGKSTLDSRPTNADDITVSRDTAAASIDDGFLSSHPVSKSAKSAKSATLQLQHQPGQTIKWRSQREKKRPALLPSALLHFWPCCTASSTVHNWPDCDWRLYKRKASGFKIASNRMWQPVIYPSINAQQISWQRAEQARQSLELPSPPSPDHLFTRFAGS
ncbi:hypothetical protein ACLKA6_004103 [Drosophila palustris]